MFGGHIIRIPTPALDRERVIRYTGGVFGLMTHATRSPIFDMKASRDEVGLALRGEERNTPREVFPSHLRSMETGRKQRPNLR